MKQSWQKLDFTDNRSKDQQRLGLTWKWPRQWPSADKIGSLRPHGRGLDQGQDQGRD